MLDTYFKQYFWTFNLAALALCGYLVARSANVFVGDVLRGPPTAVAAGAGDGSDAVASRASTVPTSAFLDRNLFNAEREDLVPEPEVTDTAEKTTAPGEVDMANCEKSSLRANLVATVVTSAEGRSVAVFVDPSKNEPTSHRIGDQLLDSAEIIAIEWRRVLVSNNGSCEFFSIDQDAPATPRGKQQIATAPRKSSGAAPKMELGTGVKKVSDNEYEIPRSEIDNVLGNLNVVATQARIVPSFRNGKANGFKLFSIRPGSLYSKIGIQNGDVIQKINGFEINSPDKALEIYSKLKDASNITVDLVRRGRAKTLSYGIR